MSINPIMLEYFVSTVNIKTQTPKSTTQGINMILQELHSAYSNQLVASLHSETSSGKVVKLLAPPWHCFSAASSNS